jgi:hypothetical protein
MKKRKWFIALVAETNLCLAAERTYYLLMMQKKDTKTIPTFRIINLLDC